jgi:Asp-tRNA(Asn)/Glu-tRNA(Gln) amidotransferase A subunit family amidase
MTALVPNSIRSARNARVALTACLPATGPVATRLPMGFDFLGRPFSKSTLLKIAGAYESATHHREPPPDFPLLAGDP